MAEPTQPLSLPQFGPADAAVLMARHWGIEAEATPLPGYIDRNFLIRQVSGERWILKMAYDRDGERDHLGVQADVFAALAESWTTGPSPFPTIVSPQGGGFSVSTDDGDGAPCFLRLLTYLPGTPLAHTERRPRALLRELGSLLAMVDQTLGELPEELGERSFQWEIRQAMEPIRMHEGLVQDADRRALLTRTLEDIRSSLSGLESELPLALIHNDANGHNILVEWSSEDDPAARTPRISGLIDFGDLVRSWRVAEVAVAGAYLVLSHPAPLAVLEAMVGGYHGVLPLSEAELAAIFPLIRLRLSLMVCMSAYHSRLRPDDPYLRISERPAWDALERLATIPHGLAEAHMRRAAGLEPSRAGETLRTWIRSSGLEAAPILPGLGEVSTATLDLGPGSLELADLPEGATPQAWTRTLFGRMESLGARIGIGRYDEARRWYTSPLFRAEAYDGPAWRSVHVGIDLFAPAGTPVHAPLDGVVHSVVLNAGELDYGPTLILRHEPAGGPEFFTLYGHLAWASVKDLAPGTAVRSGDPIAALGAEEENGGWAPHLHFQPIADLLGHEGEFPGVALPEDREIWCSLSPDPAPLLGISVPPPPGAREMPPGEILEIRDHHLGPNLSVSYRRPLKIVRGWMQYLYDHEGQTYLDGVNNVPHVGHCHPRVVEAARRQMAVLNTNTRYLHDEIVLYSQELLATFPEPLRMVYLVNSGSEANELALRLAQAHTARRDIVALGAAYHGNTRLLVEASDYKSGGPDGSGPGEWVHTAPLPDPYRGKFRATTSTDPGAEYAAEVARIMDEAAAQDRPIGTFLAESLPGCGGQIVLPDGYLAGAYAAVRDGGGICIADEVQVGFGRVGTHFWGFETQGVVPDIVTLGKPMGNGHPLGAVITTSEIAASFHTGMEHFNTFGGNPVSCAVGRAVLSVIREEELQQRALTVGAGLERGLRELANHHPLIGDVRGLGLYLGVELVTDRQARTPAAPHASYVVNRMRDRGILLSADGPDQNVLKIKPPLQFSDADARALIETLDAVLREEPIRL